MPPPKPTPPPGRVVPPRGALKLRLGARKDPPPILPPLRAAAASKVGANTNANTNNKAIAVELVRIRRERQGNFRKKGKVFSIEKNFDIESEKVMTGGIRK